MKFAEIEKLSDAELLKREKEAKLELMKLQAQVATGTAPKSPSQIKQLRRTIARINTLRTKKEAAEQKN